MYCALRQWTGAIPPSLLSERQPGQRYKDKATGRSSPAPVGEDFLPHVLPLPLLSSVSYFAFSLLLLWCSLPSTSFSGFSHIHFPVLFSHPALHVSLPAGSALLSQLCRRSARASVAAGHRAQLSCAAGCASWPCCCYQGTGWVLHERGEAGKDV